MIQRELHLLADLRGPLRVILYLFQIAIWRGSRFATIMRAGIIVDRNARLLGAGNISHLLGSDSARIFHFWMLRDAALQRKPAKLLQFYTFFGEFFGSIF